MKDWNIFEPSRVPYLPIKQTNEHYLVRSACTSEVEQILTPEYATDPADTKKIDRPLSSLYFL